jgi:hemolysin activation/secretion protein
MKQSLFILFLVTLFLSLNFPLFAQQAGKEEKLERELEKERLLRERIEKKVEKPEVKEEKPEEIVPPIPEEKVLIKKVVVIGVTFFKEEEIRKIISPFENKELTLREMQKVADLITDLYRQHGYITSRAYLPPQKIEEGVLEIRVLEGTMGDLEIKGNRYFKTSLFEKRITLEKGEPFNYNELRKNLIKINERPDRTARAVLTPGKEPGQTDLKLEVKDKFPVHLGFDYDNFGSRYVDRDRYALNLNHNNLSGNDDILSLKLQKAEAEAYTFRSLRYLLPLDNELELGFYASRSRLKLGREFKDLDARGKSTLYSLFLNKSLIDEENLDLRFNIGFDYKRIRNYQLGRESSRDEMRVVKVGLDFDKSDNYGRTIITNELDFGIPEIMGGLKSKDARASRSGSGGKFIKNTVNLLRLQRMFWHSTLLWRNQLQLSPYILTAAEQFQIGGIGNMRGYPPAEKVGDRGFATSLEWSFPPYLIPKDLKFPFSKGLLYDAFRLVTFYDWAYTRLRRPQAGEEKDETLRSAGFGFRLNLPENFNARVDFGYPIGKTPSDGKHLHTWVQVTKSF